MEFNISFKINGFDGSDSSNMIGIAPWAILIFGGSFTVASLYNGSAFLMPSFLVFLWGVVSSFARIIYKDKITFLEKSGEKKYGEKHKEWWRIYYYFQFLFLLLFTLFFNLWLL